ncbi:hypothetical protein ACVDG5_008300 [Mesorhizobium sp. ORM6]
MLEHLSELALDGVRQFVVAVGKRLARSAGRDGCDYLGGRAGDVVAGEATGKSLPVIAHRLDARSID